MGTQVYSIYSELSNKSGFEMNMELGKVFLKKNKYLTKTPPLLESSE
jgi:hypothetical protein